MSLRKYTMGRILRSKEEKEEQKTAAKNFTDEDRKELHKENCDRADCCRDGRESHG